MAAPMKIRCCPYLKQFNQICDRRWCQSSSQPLKERSVTKDEVQIDPDILEKLQSGEMKARKNPGIMSLKTIALPDKLEKAAKLVIQKNGQSGLIQEALRLNTSLMMRQMPIEREQIPSRVQRIAKKIIEKDRDDPKKQMKENYDEKFMTRVERELKNKHLSHWKKILYDSKTGIQYMVARLAQNYAVLLQVLHEIWTRDPSYVPKSLYDHGSGIGSLIWAVQNNPSWRKEIGQYYCVDPSPEISNIAMLLLKDGRGDNEMCIKNVYFRTFPPSSKNNSFSTVVSAYTLMEHENRIARQEIIEKLWDLTEDYLVLVETGSLAGHILIQEARDHILSISNHVEEDKKGHVFAPCPHQLPCPKMKLHAIEPCAFTVNYRPLELITRKISKATDRFAYVIIRKGKKIKEEHAWPRIVSPSKFSVKHLRCRLCRPDGNLDPIIVTKFKHSKELYAIGKRNNLGDFLPVTYPGIENNTSVTDDNIDVNENDKVVENKA